ncbi:Hypothetical protein POVR1_LOCUS153 [uncultured virus]|nr:Hypothetical protein POVR1_LOCUS153 [uncultured virus]
MIASIDTHKQQLVISDQQSFDDEFYRLERLYYQMTHVFLPGETGVGALDWSYLIGSVSPENSISLADGVDVTLVSEKRILYESGLKVTVAFRVGTKVYKISNFDRRWNTFAINQKIYHIVGTGLYSSPKGNYLCYRLTTDPLSD